MWNASNFAETSLSRSVSVLLLPHQSQNTFHLPPASLAEIWNDQDSCLVSCSQEVSGFECLVLHQSWYRENVYFCPPSSFRFSFQEMQIAWQSLRNIKTFKRLLSFSYLFLSFFFSINCTLLRNENESLLLLTDTAIKLTSCLQRILTVRTVKGLHIFCY